MQRTSVYAKSSSSSSSSSQYSVACGFSHRAEMNNAEMAVATLISNSRFFRLPFNFTIYKTIKPSHSKITFMIITSINVLM